jgi:hypothetical protein
MGKTGDDLDLAVGQSTLGNIFWFPVILIAVFAFLYMNRNKLEKFGGVSTSSH